MGDGQLLAGDIRQDDDRHRPGPPTGGLGRALLPALVVLLTAALGGCADDYRFVQRTACGTSVSWSCVAPRAETKSQPPVADATDAGSVAAEYDRRLLELLAADRTDRMRKQTGYTYDWRALSDIAGRRFRSDYQALSALAAATATDEAAARAVPGKPGTYVFDHRWRTARSDLYLGDPAGNGRPRSFQFSSLQAVNVEIAPHVIADATATLAGSCDGALTVVSHAGETAHPAGAAFKVTVSGDAMRMLPDDRLTKCAFRVSLSDGGGYALTVLREETADPSQARLDSLYEACPQPDLDRLSPLERAFISGRWLSQTCPFPIGRPKLLDDQRAGFDAKVEALLGTRLPSRFYDDVNPELPLDFSHAPKLSLIYVSYLDFKADFSGRVIERLLCYHAARGTKVRITVTKVLLRPKDKAMLEALAAEYPNVQLQEFSFEPPSGTQTEEQLSHFHKSHHVKMLAVLSSEPGKSRAIFGGRNIHDGFLFTGQPDLSRFPELTQYHTSDRTSLDYFANYQDFDIEISDAKPVRRIVEQMATLWHHDADTGMIRPFSVPVADGAPGSLPDGQGRHFISIPYEDGQALERFYVDLFDAARHTIEICNPYLNLTPKLTAAFERALKRGVKVTIVGRINLRGDLGGNVLTELNERFVKKYADRISLYEFRDESLLLHVKLLMIDGRLVTVSSVNLNHRSFIHDSENGVAVLDRGFYRRMKKIFEAYRAQAVRLDSKVTVPLIYRILFSSKIVRDAL